MIENDKKKIEKKEEPIKVEEPIEKKEEQIECLDIIEEDLVEKILKEDSDVFDALLLTTEVVEEEKPKELSEKEKKEIEREIIIKRIM